MPKYAHGTKVSIPVTQGQILELLTKRGATKHMIGGDIATGASFLAFVYEGKPIRLQINPPDPREFDTQDRIDRECRRLWRVMLIWVKGQLEAIDNGLLTPYSAFLPHMQLEDGRTVSEAAHQGEEVRVAENMRLPGPMDA